MKVRMIGHVVNGHGAFKPGDEVDLPDVDAQPLVDCGAAEVAVEAKKKRKEGAE